MFYYRMYGLVLESDRPIKILKELDGVWEPDVTISSAVLQKELEEVCKVQEEGGNTNEKGEKLWRLEKLTRELAVAYIVEVGLFRMTGGKTLEYRMMEGVDAVWFEQWLLCYAVTILMIQREQIVLHGSGLCWENQMVVISGESGSGKSTLTDALLRRGYGFMADDSVAFHFKEGKIYGAPTYPLRKLCANAIDCNMDKSKLIYMPDADREKYGIPMKESYHDEMVEPKALFILSCGDVSEVQVAEVTGKEKIKCITECLYKRPSYGMIGFTPRLLQDSLSLAGKLLIYRIIRPLEGNSVDAMADGIDKILKMQ